MSEAGTGGAPVEQSTAGRQRLYLHVGLPKSGTTFLQGLMANNRTRLKEVGYIYPFIRRETMFHTAVELRGQHERWGLEPSADILVDGCSRPAAMSRSWSGHRVRLNSPRPAS